MEPKSRLEERELDQVRASRDELAERIARHLPSDGSLEAAPGVFLYRFSSPTGPFYGVTDPSFCVIAQGGKEVLLGKERYRYDEGHYLLVSVGLPVVGSVVEASLDRPYLAVRIVLDPGMVTPVLIEAGVLASQMDDGVKAIAVSRLDASLLDAVVRLIRLLDARGDYGVLAPLVVREIAYRLTHGEQAGRLRQIAVLSGRAHRIARAIELLRKDYRKPLRVADLARQAGMSVSSFHHDFKAVTAMSPLQFQKQLRLQEARRLLLAGDVDAARAGYRVGYEEASHFSREYKKLFGEPPIRDVERLRGAAEVLADSSLRRGERRLDRKRGRPNVTLGR